MGWLGWTEKEALETDVNSILIAMEGKMEMMYPGCKQKKVDVGTKFKEFAANHNRDFAVKNK